MFPVAAAIVLAFTSALESRLEAELARFPARNVTNQWVEFASEHFHWVSAQFRQARDENAAHYANWLFDAIQSQTPWELLQQAQNRALPIASRRASLDNLRGVIGSQDFINGEMPPAVPLSRFKEGKPPAWFISFVKPVRGDNKQADSTRLGIMLLRF